MDPYIGEIRMFAGNFGPAGWMLCEGQLIPISENAALFSLIGTTYGGDGQNTFALPDLRGRLTVHQGNGGAIGSPAGAEMVTPTVAQIPSHIHAQADPHVGAQLSPINNIWAAAATNIYTAGPADTTLAASAIGTAGGSQPHTNLSPYLCMNFIISLLGIYPSQN